jgi:chemotaxis protein MotB
MSSRRNKGGGGGHGGGGEERWLLPYADMITLLLGLFIVLFAMSSIDAKQFDHVKRSLAETFSGAVLDNSGGVMDGSAGIMDPNASTAAPTPSAVQLQEAARRTGAKFDDQAKQLKALVKESGLGNDVQVTTNERGTKINLAGDALFDSGSWEIKPSFRAKLIRIERQLAAFKHPIEIAGHTDGVPFPGGNRALGWNRAYAVFQLFVQQGYDPSKIDTKSWGDDKPLTKPQSTTQANARNRRIEITVLQSAANSGLSETERVAKLAEQAQSMSPEKVGQPVAEQLGEEFDTAIVEDLVATTSGDG